MIVYHLGRYIVEVSYRGIDYVVVPIPVMYDVYLGLGAAILCHIPHMW